MSFSFSMGLTILGGGSEVVSGVLAMSVLRGICSCLISGQSLFIINEYFDL